MRNKSPIIYEINIRTWLQELSQSLGRPATLDDIDHEQLERFVAFGFHWIWLMGIWQTGAESVEVLRNNESLRQEWTSLLPGIKDEDYCGSPFAVSDYAIMPGLGDAKALARLKERLNDRGLRLMLDFVPNHTALDHPWVREHPEFFINGSEDDLHNEPTNFRGVDTNSGFAILAHGRDPYFPAWVDTFQLNYRHRGLRDAMCAELARIARFCDGVRCDMAMLILPETIERTWGEKSIPADSTMPADTSFWVEAIPRIRSEFPDFIFMAEVYWDLEETLLAQGFDYVYDKRLYDYLIGKDVPGLKAHLAKGQDFLGRSVHFLENHDEPRAAAIFTQDRHPAAAIIAYTVPGMRMLHEGQIRGRREKAPCHMRIRPKEPPDPGIQYFYTKLLRFLKRFTFDECTWNLLDALPQNQGDTSNQQCVAFSWSCPLKRLLVLVVNYGNSPARCLVRCDLPDPECAASTLFDPINEKVLDYSASNLAEPGLRFDLQGWEYRVLEVRPETGPGTTS